MIFRLPKLRFFHFRFIYKPARTLLEQCPISTLSIYNSVTDIRYNFYIRKESTFEQKELSHFLLRLLQLFTVFKGGHIPKFHEYRTQIILFPNILVYSDILSQVSLWRTRRCQPADSTMHSETLRERGLYTVPQRQN